MVVTPTLEWAKKHAFINNAVIREALAEFFGTLVLCFMVVGSGLFHAISNESYAVPVLGTIFGLMVCIIVFGGISGAHINPAVTIGLAFAGELSWLKVPIYIVVQMVGGVLGSLLAYCIYSDQIFYGSLGGDTSKSVPELDAENGLIFLNSFSPTNIGTFLGIGLLTEIILTAILLMSVLACTEKGKNMEIPKFYLPFMLALTVGGLAMANGLATGAMLNPARDMAPRLAALVLGWKSEDVFENINFKGERQQWWVVGIFGPIIGSVLGVIFYSFVVSAQLPRDEPQTQSQTTSKGQQQQMVEGSKDDWRNTVFIPRTVTPTSNNVPSQYTAVPAGYMNQQQMGGPLPVNGQYNAGYIRDDTRQRQGY